MTVCSATPAMKNCGGRVGTDELRDTDAFPFAGHVHVFPKCETGASAGNHDGIIDFDGERATRSTRVAPPAGEAPPLFFSVEEGRQINAFYRQ